MVAYLTGVLPVHRVDGRPRVHVHQVVVVVAGHHTPTSVVELHGQAGVAADGAHGVGVVAAPPGDLQAVPPEGGHAIPTSFLFSAGSSRHRHCHCHSLPLAAGRDAATLSGLGCSAKCSLGDSYVPAVGRVVRATTGTVPRSPDPRPSGWTPVGTRHSGEPSARAPDRPMRGALASAQPSIGQPSGADVLLASVSWPGLASRGRHPPPPPLQFSKSPLGSLATAEAF